MNQLLRILPLFWFCLLPFGSAWGQQHQLWQDTIQQQFPYSTRKLFPLPALVSLDSTWQEAGGATHRIPFVFSGRTPHTLSYTFVLECPPREDIYVYFEGIAWQAEVLFNDKYLGVHEDPFEPWLVPVREAWLADSGAANKIEVRLSGGEWFTDYPETFTGIFRPAHILTADQLPRYAAPGTSPDSLHKRIASLAPYFGKTGPVFNEQAAGRMLHALLEEGIGQVYFPFGADRQLRNLLIQSGIEIVSFLPDTVELAYLNEYPAERASLSGTRYFWLDDAGHRTDAYQSYFSVSPRQRLPVITSRFLLALLMLFPLLSLFAIKGISPGFFYSLDAVLFSPKLYIDTFADSTYANLGLVFILMAIKTLATAALLTMCVYYIQVQHQWDALNLIKEWSNVSTVFYQAHTLSGIFFRSLLLVVLWLAFKYFCVFLFGNVYGYRGMLLGMMNLDIVSTFPLVLLVSVPVSFIYFVPQVWGGGFVLVIFFVWMAYFLRRQYVYFVGLDRLFMLSLGVKILYICAFNILPYFILF